MIEVHHLKNIVIFIQRIINFYNTNLEPEQLKVSKNSSHINIDNLKLLLQVILISFDFNSQSQLETRQMVKIPTLKANLLEDLEKIQLQLVLKKTFCSTPPPITGNQSTANYKQFVRWFQTPRPLFVLRYPPLETAILQIAK